MSAQNTSSTSGLNPYNFSSGISSASGNTQIPSALAGLGSTTNLSGTGTSANVDGSSYDPISGNLFINPNSSSNINLNGLSNSLAAGSKIATSSGQNSNQMRTMGQSKVTLPATSFSDGITSAGDGSSSSNTGVQNLLTLMQQLGK